MRYLPELFRNNRSWVTERLSEDKRFFERMTESQEPPYLWIGCADSRVPANEIVGLAPGELFVHRNVANVVARDDINLQSVLQYAIDFIKVHHVIVCGHYGCGGVAAALGSPVEEPLNRWIEHIRTVRDEHKAELDLIDNHDARWRRLCEVNVVAQAAQVCRSPLVRRAWERQQQVVIHGWIYDLADGLLRDLEVTEDGTGAEGIAPRIAH